MVESLDSIEYAGLTDVGIRRSHNQDAYAVRVAGDRDACQERGHLFLVSDGMGAHAVGELASKLATELIPHTYQKHAAQGAVEALQRAFAEANTSIHMRGQHNREFEGMGTTSTAVLLRPEGAWIAHVGDSRAYRIRSGRTEQLSYDHSLQWELARRQRVQPDQVTGVPANVIIRSLGPEAAVEIDVEGPHPILPGDKYLLCSDGLSGQVSDQEMGAIVGVLPLSEACQLLIDLANLRGGPDNITVVLAQIPGESPEVPVHEEPVASPPPRPPWHEKLPWTEIALGTGVALAIAALVLIFLEFHPASYIFTFVLAVAALGGGLWGLWKNNYLEQTQEAEDAPPRPVQVYKRTSWRVDLALLDRFQVMNTTLEQRVRERDWQVDWDEHRQHLEKAQQCAVSGDLTEAFRKQCLAMALLTAVLRTHRTKEEVFQPSWEKRS